MLVALVLLLAFSAFFSASETAISSINKIRVKNRAEEGDKKAAVAQFSFLMVLAPILGETLLEAVSGDLTAGVAAGPLAAGFLASFVTGCLACKFMIEIVKRGKLIWFALYCAAAGLVSILSYFC